MADTMSPDTDVLAILTDDDVGRYKKDKLEKQITDLFGHSFAHLTAGQRSQIVDPTDGPKIIRGGWDS